MSKSDGVFLRVGDSLVLLEPRRYASEDLLQKALEQFPEVLAGPTTTGEEPTGLALVRREQPISDRPEGAGRWSLDHLFVDARGVPVLVEVKRSSDTRIRREVIGQLLEYAANGLRHWRSDTLQDAFRETCLAAGRSEDEAFELLGTDQTAEAFWRTVTDNLESGRVRLLFVADELPEELVRVIEFLNERMTPTEVLGVELRQYVGGGHDEHVMYVPTVVGRTTTAVDRKHSSTGVSWTPDTFADEAASRCAQDEQALIQRLLAHVEESQGKLSWGSAASPGVGGWYPLNDNPAPTWVLRLRPPDQGGATIEWSLGALVTRIGPERVAAFADKLAAVPALAPKIESARAAEWNKWPSVSLREVLDTSTTDAMFAALNTLCETPQS